ncbi:MAG TPA: transglutaminase-like domain-containing protein [Rhizomicrobium sp.]|nr:transglutaminase-like domain-containing protein [Rhizomicrobium sp.]
MPDNESPLDFLSRLGQAGEGPHDIAVAALMLSSLDHPTVPLAPARAHLDEIAQLARAEAPLMANVEDGARLLSNLLAGRCGYDGDRLTYDDPRNADLIQVITRRRGMPVALGIIYMHAARAAGLQASGLDTPAHFLVMLSKSRAEVLIDPFNGGAVLDPERASGPPRMGGHEGGHLAQPVSDVDVLLRLENNLKIRALHIGDRVRALEIAKRMTMIGPGKAELWLDLARLNEANGVLGDARRAYESCLDIVRPGQSLHNEAALGLAGLKRRIN